MCCVEIVKKSFFQQNLHETCKILGSQIKYFARAERTGGATAPIARCRNQKMFADKNPTENESNHLKK